MKRSSTVLFVIVWVAALAVGLWLATLSVKFRDVRFGIDHLLQVWMFASVILPSSSIPAAWRWVYRLNPMVHAIDGFRWAMFRTHPSFNGAAPDWTTFLASVVFFALMLAGAYQFRRTERTIVDYI